MSSLEDIAAFFYNFSGDIGNKKSFVDISIKENSEIREAIKKGYLTKIGYNPVTEEIEYNVSKELKDAVKKVHETFKKGKHDKSPVPGKIYYDDYPEHVAFVYYGDVSKTKILRFLKANFKKVQTAKQHDGNTQFILEHNKIKDFGWLKKVLKALVIINKYEQVSR